MKNGLITSTRLWLLPVLLLVISGSAFSQSQIISIGILSFQDDSGTGVPPELDQRLARDLQQRLASLYRDLLPRLIATSDQPKTNPLTTEQIIQLAKLSGAKFVVYGGLLAIVPEAANNDTKVTVQLYAEVVSIDAGAVITTVRAEGTAAQTGQFPSLSQMDFKSEQFSSSGLGQATGLALTQLADSIHQAVSGNSQTTVAQPTTHPTPDAVAAKTAEADTELQQLIAQAGSLVTSGANASGESIAALNQALASLKTDLATKADLMEKGQDVTSTDQDMAAQRQALQTALAQVTAEASAQASTIGATTTQPTAQNKSVMEQIDGFTSQAISLLLKIQQLRATSQNFNPNNTGATTTPTGDGSSGSSNQTSVSDQPLGELNGVVMDQKGSPVSAAEVTDQTSGASTSTNNDGQYDLNGLLPNQVANLAVKSGDKVLNGQATVVSGHPVTLDFQFKTDSGNSNQGAQGGVLPSTIILRSQLAVSKLGILKGIVRDASGRPSPRALVSLQGLGMARTNSQGEYQFLNVPAGPQQIVVNVPGLRTRYQQVQVTGTQTSELRTQFAVGDRVPPTAGRPPLFSATGTIWAGKVLDDDGNGLAGARITAIRDQAAVSVVAGSSGAFELRNLAPGSYRLIASKAGYENSVLNLTLNSNHNDPINFKLKRQNSNLARTLLSGESGRSGVIRGRVSGPGNNPIANAIVYLKPLFPNASPASIKTNQNGEYLFNPRQGQYEVSVSSNSYQAASRIVEARAGSATQSDFSLRPINPSSPNRTQTNPGPSPVENRSVRTGTVMIQVIDAKTGRPLVGALISIGQQQASTNQTGAFTFINVPPGSFQLTVVKSGYLAMQRSFSIPPGETIRLGISLTPQLTGPTGIRRN